MLVKWIWGEFLILDSDLPASMGTICSLTERMWIELIAYYNRLVTDTVQSIMISMWLWKQHLIHLLKFVLYSFVSFSILQNCQYDFLQKFYQIVYSVKLLWPEKNPKTYNKVVNKFKNKKRWYHLQSYLFSELMDTVHKNCSLI